MTKYVYMVAAAASALLIAAPATFAEAATPSVLTIGKTGGPAVSKGDVLTSGLAKKTTATFTVGKMTVNCASATFKGKVTSNPAATGSAMATESVTASALSKCAVKGMTSTKISITANNLPYVATVSAAKGNPAKVSGTSKSKPISLTAKIVAGKIKLTTSSMSAAAWPSAAALAFAASTRDWLPRGPAPKRVQAQPPARSRLRIAAIAGAPIQQPRDNSILADSEPRASRLPPSGFGAAASKNRAVG